MAAGPCHPGPVNTIRNIFLDRDGTIILDKHYLCDPKEMELLPGALSGLQSLHDAGRKLFLVSNQSGVGRGMFSDEQRKACTLALNDMLLKVGISFKDQEHCPHAPEEGCDCRKPATGMWRKIQERHGLKPGQCVMVGDKLADLDFGRNAGFAAVILVLTGHGPEQAKSMGLPELGARTWFEFPTEEGEPRFLLARDLASACGWLLSED